jgi:hypothetical protein
MGTHIGQVVEALILGARSTLRDRPDAVQEQFDGCLYPLVDLRRISFNPQHGKASLAADDQAQEEIGRDVRILDLYLPILCEPIEHGS